VRVCPKITDAIALAVCFIVFTATPSHAQSLSIDLGSTDHAGMTGRLIQLASLITVLSLAPSLLVMGTAFTRIIIVLSLLRGALNAQGTPPNTVLIGLALFLTYFVMQPVLDQAWTDGIQPMTAGQISQMDGLAKSAEPFRTFMASTARPSDVEFFANLGHTPLTGKLSSTPWRVLVPAFLISELRRGFEIGFLLYLPFLIIDLVVASILMSLGMMMMPPSAISLPIKLIFFVLIDGWRLVAGSLVQGFPAT
jgi:flagellar biosynthesis protein FliP